MGSPRVRDLCYLEIKYTDLAHSSDLQVLWTAVMGSQTLADLVAGIFTGVSSALASVKSGLEAAWDGIRSAGEYILKSVINAMFTSFAAMFNSLLFSESKILEGIIPGFSLLTYNGTGPLTLQFMGAQRTFGMDVKDTDLSIFFPGADIHIDPFLGAHVETLGLAEIISSISNIALGAYTIIIDLVLAFAFRNLADKGYPLEAMVASIFYNMMSWIPMMFLYQLSNLHKPLPEMSNVELNDLREISLSSAMFYIGISLGLVILVGIMIGTILSSGFIISTIVASIFALFTGFSLSWSVSTFTGSITSFLDPLFGKLTELTHEGGEFILPLVSLVYGIFAGLEIANVFLGGPRGIDKNLGAPTNSVSLASVPLILSFLARYMFLSYGFSLVVDAVDLEIARR